jgi:hypothetical protein
MDAGVFRACKQSWMDGTRRWKMHFGWVRFMVCFDYDVGCGAWWIVGLYWMDAWEGESLLELGAIPSRHPGCGGKFAAAVVTVVAGHCNGCMDAGTKCWRRPRPWEVLDGCREALDECCRVMCKLCRCLHVVWVSWNLGG